jgi:hypothetical protein
MIERGGFHEDFTREEKIEGSSDRGFGLVFAAFFALIGALAIWKENPRWILWAGLAAMFLLIALVRPGILKPLNRLWTLLGLLIVADVVKERRQAMTAEELALFGIDKLHVPRSDIPAVTHVDYSARIQTVQAETNPRYHALLTAFKARTGCPVLVNTSFNVRRTHRLHPGRRIPLLHGQ